MFPICLLENPSGSLLKGYTREIRLSLGAVETRLLCLFAVTDENCSTTCFLTSFPGSLEARDSYPER